MDDIKAIIAEDEKVLREHLHSQLKKAWPELRIVGEARNGVDAVALIEQYKPHIAFLDIRMPGLSGLDVARKIPGACRAVFVTAYDEYAVKAFENEAIDYLLKPVTPERLAKTVERLKRTLTAPFSDTFENLKGVERVLTELKNHQAARPLRWVRVQRGDSLQLISVDEIFYFKAGDKYTVVRTETDEYLIRKPIKTLIRELDSQHFWQIHRGTIVNVSCVAGVSRSLTGKGVLRLRNMSDTLSVSQAHMHLFRQM